MVRFLFRLSMCCCSFFILGCAGDEELLTGLEVQEAIEITVTLKNSGLGAQMQKFGSARNERYAVSVPRSDRNSALRILNELHLPRPPEESFTSLTAGDGYIPNLRETANLRLDRALGVEIERALSALEGIVEAKAIVRSYLVSTGSTELPGKPSASIVLRYVSRSGNQPFSMDEVKQTVERAVPGLAQEDISVSATRVFVGGENAGSMGIDGKSNMVPLAPVAPFPFLVPAADKERVRAIVSALLGAFALVGLIIGWSLNSFMRKPKGPPPKMVRTAVLEASFKGGPGSGNLPPPRNTGAIPPKGQ